MNDRELMQQALDALDCIYSPLHVREINKVGGAIKALRSRLAQPEREWQGLTDEELLDIADMAYANDLELLQTLQAKLKEKNHG